MAAPNAEFLGRVAALLANTLTSDNWSVKWNHDDDKFDINVVSFVTTYGFRVYLDGNVVLGQEISIWDANLNPQIRIALVEFHDGVPFAFVVPASNVLANIALSSPGPVTLPATATFASANPNGETEALSVTYSSDGSSAIAVDIVTPVGNFVDGNTQSVNWLQPGS